MKTEKFTTLSEKVQKTFIYALTKIAHQQKRQLFAGDAEKLLTNYGEFYYDSQTKSVNLTVNSRDLIQTHLERCEVLTDEDISLNESIKLYFIANEEKTYFDPDVSVEKEGEMDVIHYSPTNNIQVFIPLQSTDDNLLKSYTGYRIHSVRLLQYVAPVPRTGVQRPLSNHWESYVTLFVSDSQIYCSVDLPLTTELSNIYDYNIVVNDSLNFRLANFPIFYTVTTDKDNFFLVEIAIVKE